MHLYIYVLYLSVTSLSRCRVRDKRAVNVSRCVAYRKEGERGTRYRIRSRYGHTNLTH